MGNVPVGQLEMDIGRPPELIKRSNLRSEMWGTGKFWSSTEKALLTESKRTGSCMNSEFLNLQSLQEELVSMIRGVYRKDERISERSRYESRLDESSSISSKIPRLELNPNPYEE
ncbi:hypothetical protein CK203_102875 [Vitis vinifera]|uniref:Uncharacterized protein n=1 Tax=Vitis vinifera TaxID=29760 RepID=A0A438C6I8_VITVI|nr:hypothetical protein CK203_102875 [Vitis vinifera]